MSVRSLGILAFVFIVALGAGFWWYEHSIVYRLSLAAGPRGGEAYALARAIARVTRKHHPKIQIDVLETEGAEQNMELLREHLVDIAMVQADTLAAPPARLIASLYPVAFQLVVREDSQIEKFGDLRGHIIALPPEGSGPFKSFWHLAEHYALSRTDFEAVPMSAGAASYAMYNGSVDGVFQVRAPGNPNVLELIERGSGRLLPVEQASAMRLKTPALTVGVIPRGAYRGEPPLPKQDLETVSLQRLLVAHAVLDEEVAAKITGIMFERQRELVNITPLAGFLSPPNSESGTFLPVHEGAQRFYDRDEPSFLQEQAEPIALIISLAAILASGLLQLKSRRQKQRVDRYNRHLMEVYAKAAGSSDLSELKGIRGELLSIVDEVVDDAENGRISEAGFNFFSFTWEAVSSAVQECESGLNEQGEEGAYAGKRAAGASSVATKT